MCGRPFTARNPKRLSCSAECVVERRKQVDAKRAKRRRHVYGDYHRWKNAHRRQLERLTDITPAQEAEMRRRARKCPLCSIFMTSKAHQPNSKELDHIIPLNIGGTHTHGNVRIICRGCNLRRPKDGSDLDGWQPTLWATAPEVITKTMPASRPKLPKPTAEPSWCACGNQLTARTATRCTDCLDRLAIQAAALRADGMAWWAVCRRLGYPSPGGLFARVRRIAEQEELAA